MAKKLDGIKVVLVIAPDQFRDEELFVPKAELEKAGAETIVASTRTGQAKGMLGGAAHAETSIKDLREKDYDAIVVVGGMGSPEYLWEDKELHALLRGFQKASKVYAAICLSGAVLAKAGVLEGKQATVWETPESRKALEEGKAKFVNQPVVHDGKVVTANGPEAAADFAGTIINELSKVAAAK